jgi:sensor c-di-GMP phosphodiesterase-like protein
MTLVAAMALPMNLKMVAEGVENGAAPRRLRRDR